MSNKLNSIEKSLDILDQLGEPPFEYTATQLANNCGINRTTIHRILNNLIEADYVIKKSDNKRYRLGPKLYKLGSVYLEIFSSENKIVEILSEISLKTKESVGLAIRDDNKVISLYEYENNQPMKMNYRAGLIYPMNRGCYGKCLMAYHDKSKVIELLNNQTFEKVQKNTLTSTDEILAEYKRIREQGYVISIEETFKFGIAVGIPLKNHDGSVSTCVAVSFFKDENYIDKIERFKNILLDYKSELEKYLI